MKKIRLTKDKVLSLIETYRNRLSKSEKTNAQKYERVYRKLLEAVYNLRDIKRKLGMEPNELFSEHYKMDERAFAKDLVRLAGSVERAMDMLRYLEEHEVDGFFFLQTREALQEISDIKELVESVRLLEARKKKAKASRKKSKKKENKWIQKSVESGKVRRGKMHEVLGIPENKDIDDVYKSGESLARALVRKVGRGRAMKMINWAANASGDPLYKQARAYLKETASEEKGKKKK